MVVRNLPDILQQKMNTLFQVFEFIFVYIGDLLILTQEYYKYHAHILEITVNKLKWSLLKHIIEASFFWRTKIYYLGLWLTCDVVRHLNKKLNK